MRYLLLLLLLTGCSGHVGMAVRGNGNDYLNTLENPVGTVRLEREYSTKFRGYCEHISSIPDKYDRPGTNFCGGEIRLW